MWPRCQRANMTGVVNHDDEVVAEAGIEGAQLGLMPLDEQPHRLPPAAAVELEADDDSPIGQVLLSEVEPTP
jgi:hypothetical protein